jgi:selenocysteine lyase/cysteine desulfurase
MRGGTITINFYDPEGVLIDYRLIEQRANDVQISLRTGCFCNPGADEMAHGLTKDDLEHCFHDSERMTFEQFLVAMDGKSAGAVRVSLGIASNFADVFAFSQFARSFLDRPASEV